MAGEMVAGREAGTALEQKLVVLLAHWRQRETETQRERDTHTHTHRGKEGERDNHLF